MRESEFQTIFLNRVKELLPNCFVLKNDANMIQGFPDWTVIFGKYALIFEIKRNEKAAYQPNQLYYIDFINNSGGFARIVYPENMEEVLHEIQQTYRP